MAPGTRTPDPFLRRLADIRRRFDGWKVAGLLVTDPCDVRYLTGFTGEDSWVLLTRRGAPTILSDSRFAEQIRREAPWCRRSIRRAGLEEELRSLRSRRRFGRLALQSAHLTVAARRRLVRCLGARSLRDVDDGLREQRAVKTPAEVRQIERAGAIQQQAMLRLLGRLEPGLTERRVAAMLDFEMSCLGAEGTSFPTIVASGANSSLPHARPGTARLRRGGVVLIDWGARVGGYCSDMTRVYALGRMPARIGELYRIVLDAQLAAIDRIAPGVEPAEVDAAARRVIRRAGYGRRFGHSLGHGIGLDVHELPSLSPRAKGALEPGNVVTVEPGIYVPRVGGVRIEDDVLVTARGRRVLTAALPKDLDSAVI